MSETKTAFDAWAEKYRPIKNQFTKGGEDLFDTHGEEGDFVKAQDPHCVWTFADGEMATLIHNGYGLVNRLGYYVTEVPWEGEDYIEVVVTEDVECECYDEERGEETDEYGDEDCEICEGYGYATKAVLV